MPCRQNLSGAFTEVKGVGEVREKEKEKETDRCRERKRKRKKRES